MRDDQPNVDDAFDDEENIKLADACYAVSDFLTTAPELDPELRRAYAAWVAYSFKSLQESADARRAQLSADIAQEEAENAAASRANERAAGSADVLGLRGGRPKGAAGA